MNQSICQGDCTRCKFAIVEHLWDDFCYCPKRDEIVYLNEQLSEGYQDDK